MNSHELLEYVRRAMDLEMDVYEAQQIEDNFYQSVKAHKPRMPAKPRYEFGNGLLPPKKPEEDNLSVMAIITFFGAVVLACMGVFATDGRGVTEASIAFFIFSGLSIVLTVGLLLSRNKAMEEYQVELQKFEEERRQYQLALNEIEYRNQEKKEAYGRSLVTYSEEVADYVNRSNAERDVLLDAKWKLQAALRNLYEEGVIYPKYQNLVAVSTIYEYLASGRCDRLEGPNGAYNLYEMELRQNIVIGQLSTITEHLEQIKENQYTLYYEIQSANNNSASMLSSIGDDVKFSAYQNAATAKNVETMRYISMMKNVWNGKGF